MACRLVGVDPAYQKKGLGKALLLEALRFTLEHDGELLFLNTWSGNLKVMPLYKRQGYKWRPHTDVLMENYLPLILTYPPFVKFFEEHCWHDVFRPVITQEPDEELEERMWIYSYIFEGENGERLKTWIDRAVGAISGFDIRSRYLKLKCKLTVPDSEAFIGLDTVPVSLVLHNREDCEQHVNLEIILPEYLVMKDKPGGEVILAPHEEKILTLTVSLADSTPEKDLRANPSRYTDSTITVQVIVDDFSFPLKVGMIPRRAILIQPYPAIPVHAAGTRDELTINLINRTSRDLPTHVNISGAKSIELDKTEFSSTVSPLDASLQVPMSIKNVPSTVEVLKVAVKTAEGNVVLDERKIGIFLVNECKTLIWEETEDYIVFNGKVIVQVPKIPKKVNSVRRSSSHRSIPSVRCAPLILGYPFDVSGSEFHAKQLNHDVQETEVGITVSSSGTSDVKKGMKVTREVTVLNGEEGMEVTFVLENTTNMYHAKLGIMLELWMEHHENPISIYFASHEGIQLVPFELLQWSLDVERDTFAEGWMVFESETGVIGLLFDEHGIVRVKQQGPYYLVEMKVRDAGPGDVVRTIPLKVIFASNWKEIRQQWHAWKHGKKLPAERMRDEPRDFLQVGLHVDATNPPSHSVLLDATNLNFHVGYQCVFPKKNEWHDHFTTDKLHYF